MPVLLCSRCQEAECDCCTCRFCRERTDTVCPRCEGCEDGCCECYTCHNCGDRVERVCSTCEQCTDDCCECYYCECCENRVRPDYWISCCERCEDCRDRDEENECGSCGDGADGRVIHGYSYDVLRRLDFQPYYASRYFGVELEMVAKRTARGAANETLQAATTDWFLFKHDGSLPCHGAELVTAPMTLEKHQQRWPELQGALREHWSSWKSPETGLHIHVSRRGRFQDTIGKELSQLTIGKVLVFLNDTRNSALREFVAGRESVNYACMKKKTILDGKLAYTSQRYEFVNLQNDHTIEFRLFKGSCKVERVLMNLEFLDCLLDWVEFESYQALTWENYIAYANKKGGAYLRAYLKRFMVAIM